MDARVSRHDRSVVSALHEVSGFFALSVDDARADVIGIAPSGKCWRSLYKRPEDIWPCPFLLLHDAHSADSLCCDYCFAPANRVGCAVAVHESSRDESAFAARICLESGIALLGLVHRGGSALRSMPLVRRTEAATKGHRVPQLFVRRVPSSQAPA